MVWFTNGAALGNGGQAYINEYCGELAPSIRTIQKYRYYKKLGVLNIYWRIDKSPISVHACTLHGILPEPLVRLDQNITLAMRWTEKLENSSSRFQNIKVLKREMARTVV
jgi:hypothetical protein